MNFFDLKPLDPVPDEFLRHHKSRFISVEYFNRHFTSVSMFAYNGKTSEAISTATNAFINFRMFVKDTTLKRPNTMVNVVSTRKIEVNPEIRYLNALVEMNSALLILNLARVPGQPKFVINNVYVIAQDLARILNINFNQKSKTTFEITAKSYRTTNRSRRITGSVKTVCKRLKRTVSACTIASRNDNGLQLYSNGSIRSEKVTVRRSTVTTEYYRGKKIGERGGVHSVTTQKMYKGINLCEKRFFRVFPPGFEFDRQNLCISHNHIACSAKDVCFMNKLTAYIYRDRYITGQICECNTMILAAHALSPGVAFFNQQGEPHNKFW